MLERNFRSKFGEIDLVMQEGNIIVFIEVRMRNNLDYANGFESVIEAKKARIIKTANYYLLKNRLTDKVNSRFDMVAVQMIKDKYHCDWIADFFQT